MSLFDWADGGEVPPPRLPEGDGSSLVVTKFAGTQQFSTEVWPVHVETPTERAYADSLTHELLRVREAAKQQAYAYLWSTLLELVVWEEDRAAGAVLQLHAPVEDRYVTMACGVCNDGDMDLVPWPCETVRVVAGVYGIPIPEVIR